MAIYGSTSGADTYHDARPTAAAWAAVTGPDEAMQVASDYIDYRIRSQLNGLKTGGRAQEREYPRTGATDASGYAIPSDETPVEILNAVYEAALIEGTTAGSLFKTLKAGSPLVKRVKAGETEVEFALYGGAQPSYPAIEAALTGLFGSTSQYAARVVRG